MRCRPCRNFRHYYGYCNKENTVVGGEWRLGELRGEFELLKK